MKKIVGALVLTAVLVGCAETGNTQGVQLMPKGGSASEATKSQDVREEVWLQLSKEVKEEIVGSWESGKVEKVTIETQRFQGAEKFKGKELLMISFPSKREAVLGPVIVFVDPQTHKIVGYGGRD